MRTHRLHWTARALPLPACISLLSACTLLLPACASTDAPLRPDRLYQGQSPALYRDGAGGHSPSGRAGNGTPASAVSHASAADKQMRIRSLVLEANGRFTAEIVNDGHTRRVNGSYVYVPDLRSLTLDWGDGVPQILQAEECDPCGKLIVYGPDGQKVDARLKN